MNEKFAFWYAKDQKAIENIASIPFLEVVGSDITDLGPDKLPGMITYPYYPCIGGEDLSRSSYTTKAADAYFQYVTQGFTGGVDFEAPDLLFTAISASALFAAMEEGRRAIGAMSYYLQFNQYYAESIVKGLGFDFNNLKRNKKDFIAEFNLVCDQINKIIAVPKQFFIADRWIYLASSVFTDTLSPEYSTAYAFLAKEWPIYDGTSWTTGTSLKAHYKPNGYFTKDSFFAYIQTMLDALTGDDPRAMFGAIRRVYSGSDFRTISYLESNYTVPIQLVDSVAMQLHNAHFFDDVVFKGMTSSSTTEGWVAWQDASGVINTRIYANSISENRNADLYGTFEEIDDDRNTSMTIIDSEFLLDLYDHMVSPGTVLDATAFMVPVESAGSFKLGSQDSGNTVYRIFPRTEVLGVPYFITTPEEGAVKRELITIAPQATSDTSVAGFDTESLSAISHVDSHPLLRTYWRMAGVGNVVYSNAQTRFYIGEIDKYTKVEASKIRKMHDRTFFNLLMLPENSKNISK